MKNKITFSVIIALSAITFFFASCSKTEVSNFSPQGTSTDERSEASNKGFVYTMSNDSLQNSILTFSQNSDGTLTLVSTIPSGGAGTGAPLGSQGSIALDDQHQWVYAVNAGSNSISSFKVGRNGSLTLSHTVNVDGTTPVSLTLHDNFLYVVNSGSSNIQGFTIGSDGELTSLDGSQQSLSAAGANPAEIMFKPDGAVLCVTEKATNMITTYLVDGGVAGSRISTPSSGQTPFGFDFSVSVNMIVSDAFNGDANSGAVTSYYVGGGGKPKALGGGPVADFQTSPCWVVISKDGQHAFVTNTGSDAISTYDIATDGTLTLQVKTSATTGAAPADIVISSNARYVYTVNQKGQSLGEFKLGVKGQLKSVGEYFGLPAGASGLVNF